MVERLLCQRVSEEALGRELWLRSACGKAVRYASIANNDYRGNLQFFSVRYSQMGGSLSKLYVISIC